MGRYQSASHPLRLVSTAGGAGRVRVALDKKQDVANADFEIGYSVWHEVITASCLVLPQRPTASTPPSAESGGDSRGTFFLNVSPPAPDCAEVSGLAVVPLWLRGSLIAYVGSTCTAEQGS